MTKVFLKSFTLRQCGPAARAPARSAAPRPVPPFGFPVAGFGFPVPPIENSVPPSGVSPAGLDGRWALRRKIPPFKKYFSHPFRAFARGWATAFLWRKTKKGFSFFSLLFSLLLICAKRCANWCAKMNVNDFRNALKPSRKQGCFGVLICVLICVLKRRFRKIVKES